MVYQKQDGEEAIEDVVPVGKVPPPAKGEEFHTHFKQVVNDEAQVDYLMKINTVFGLSTPTVEKH